MLKSWTAARSQFKSCWSKILVFSAIAHISTHATISFAWSLHLISNPHDIALVRHVNIIASSSQERLAVFQIFGWANRPASNAYLTPKYATQLLTAANLVSVHLFKYTCSVDVAPDHPNVISFTAGTMWRTNLGTYAPKHEHLTIKVSGYWELANLQLLKICSKRYR